MLTIAFWIHFISKQKRLQATGIFVLINKTMRHAISFWESETFFAPQDFVIAGGGFVGLWTALELKKAYAKATITVLEKGAIPTGASTRNAGFACFGSPTEMASDLKTMGEDDMWRVVEMRYKGIQKIQSLFGQSLIDFETCGGYECYTKKMHNLSQIAVEVGSLNKVLRSITGLTETFVWSNEKLARQGLAGFDEMIENKLEGSLHSGKLMVQLMKMAQQSGVQILTGVSMNSWDEMNGRVQIDTTVGSFQAGQLLLATNAFTPALSSEVAVTPGRGQVLITAPIDGLQLRGTFHFDEGFYYFRNVGNRVLLGGARNHDFASEETINMDTSDQIQQALERFLQTHILPHTPYTITNRWSGIMSFTKDKKPLIAKVSPHVHSVTGCNGMGVAISPILAEQVADIFA